MYTFDSRIRYSETDNFARLTIASLINYFQDCSTFQSEDLGVGVEYMAEHHLAWVLASWQICIERYPALCEKVTVGTKPYELKGFLGLRNFLMYDGDGKPLAKANSIWSLIDADTGKPAMIPEEVKARYPMEPREEMEYAPRKISIPAGGDRGEPITIERHHLDTNQHVNNQQFIEIALGALPENFEVSQLRAEYKKQVFLQDIITPVVVKTDKGYIVSLEDTNGVSVMAAEFMKGTEKQW